MHYPTLCLQRTKQTLQANTLCASAHLFVRIREATDASQSADDISERSLSNSVFDCWVFVNNIRENRTETNLRQHLSDQNNLAIFILML
jgi:hypothetical protein